MDCQLPDRCWCAACRKLYDAARFQKIKKVRYEQVYRRRSDLTEWMRSLKAEPCADCDNTFHPAAMQFDHIGTDKVADIASMCSAGYSKARILQEISKCDLVCANCHAIRTYERRHILT